MRPKIRSIRRVALVRHVHEVDPRLVLEQLARQLRTDAGTAGGN